jgi:hypothetical protein
MPQAGNAMGTDKRRLPGFSPCRLRSNSLLCAKSLCVYLLVVDEVAMGGSALSVDT